MNIIIFASKKLHNKPFTNAKSKMPCKTLSRPCDYFGVSVLSWKCQFSSLLLRISKILASENLNFHLGLNLQYLSSLVWQCVEKVRRNITLIMLETEEVDWAFLNLSTRFPCNTEISLHFLIFNFISGSQVKFSYTTQQISLSDFSSCIFSYLNGDMWIFLQCP